MHNQSIVSWNINSVHAKYPFLQMLLHDLNPTTLCLQETKLLPNANLFLKNFNIYREDFLSAGNAKGGVLIAVRTSVYSEQVFINTDLQAVAVQIHLDIPVTVCCIYLHQSDDISNYKLQDLTKQLPEPYILTGDFNAHNIIWGSAHTDQRGDVIESFLTSTNNILLNSGLSTRFNSYNGTSTAIDLTISSCSLFPRLSWTISPSLYSSDHYPQIINLLSFSEGHKTLPPKWHFTRANWDYYRHLLDFSAVYSSKSIDSVLNTITEEILSAASASIPLTQATTLNGNFRHRVPWWNNECQQLIKEKHTLFNKCRRHPTSENLSLFKIARAKARQAIFKSKRESWRKFISTISSTTPSTQLWNKLRSINNKRTYTPIPAILNENNQLQTSVEAIAETFADHYYTITQADPSCTVDWNPPSDEYSEPEPSEINLPITVKEVQNSIRSLKNSSPGPDGIYAVMLKQINYQQLEALTFFFNRIWQEGCFPSSWREAFILPIHKPNKDKALPASYRPISLTSVLCKAMEKIVVKRLHHFLETKHLLDPYQCGFRPARSTQDNLIYLQEEINLGFHRKCHTTCVFFDIEKAFDRLLPSTILKSLQEMNIAGNITKFVFNFLSNRTFCVRIGQILSAPKLQETGTPQGSVLSPLLFILALNSITKAIQHPIQHLLYADDLVIFLQHANSKNATHQLQKTIYNLENWGAVRGLKFSPSKTKILNFTRKHHQLSLHLTLYNEPLTQVNETIFLGLKFDSKLRWTSHIHHLKQKCFQKMNILKVLNGSSWGSDRKCLLRLYKCYIQSLLSYGAILYTAASPSTLQRLDTVQHTALRIATGALRSSPTTSLHAESNVLPLYHHRNLLTLTYYFRVHSLPRHINSYRLTSKISIFSNFRNHCIQLLNQYNLISLDGQLGVTKTDILPAILHTWQLEWSQCTSNKLFKLKPILTDWTTSYQKSRKLEKVLARIRIGHTLLTHSYYYTKQPPPQCETCDTQMDVTHLLNRCLKFSAIRSLCYKSSSFSVLETLHDSPSNVKSFFIFLEKCNLISLL